MTKSDLIDLLCETKKLPKGRAELLVNTIFESMVKALQTGERIEIRGFGSFEIRNYRAYAGRNPRTGSTVDVKPKRLPFFKVGKELKDRVNAAALAHAQSGGLRDGLADGATSRPQPRHVHVGNGNGNGNGNGHALTAPPAPTTTPAPLAAQADSDEQSMPAPELVGDLPSARP